MNPTASVTALFTHSSMIALHAAVAVWKLYPNLVLRVDELLTKSYWQVYLLPEVKNSLIFTVWLVQICQMSIHMLLLEGMLYFNKSRVRCCNI